MKAANLTLVALLLLLRAVGAALFSYLHGSKSEVTSLIGASIAVGNGFLYIDGGSVSYADSEYPIPSNVTLSISLAEAWNNNTVEVSHIHQHQHHVGQFQSMLYSTEKDAIYTFGGIFPGWMEEIDQTPLHVLNLGELSATWELADNQPPQKLLANQYASTVRSSNGFHSFGGIDYFSDATYTANTAALSYDISQDRWSSPPATGPTYPYTGNTQGVFVPQFGAQGVLVVFGGQQYTNGSLDDAPKPFEDMSKIYVYDLASQEFLMQTATASSGSIPSGRYAFCVTSVQDSKTSDYDIFMYGGYAPNPSTDTSDSHVQTTSEIWVLSLPSFQWTRVFGPDPKYERNSSPCEVIGNRQMVVVGGNVSATNNVDIWTDGLGIFDMTELQWADHYNPHAAPYQRAPKLAESNKRNPYPPHWNDPRLKTIFTADQHTNQNTPNAGTSKTPTHALAPSSGPNIGAIVGGIIGALALITITILLWYIRRRRRSHRPYSFSSTTAGYAPPDEKTPQSTYTWTGYSPREKPPESPPPPPPPGSGSVGVYYFNELSGSDMVHELPAPAQRHPSRRISELPA